MEWQEFLEKDSLDGKGANDKIKPANWVVNNSDEKTENWTYMKPEDFSDIAHSEAHDDAHKIPKRPSEYSPENKPRKWKTPKHGTIHTGQEKKPATAEGEKNSKGNDMNYNRRGDELGSIERYQNKLRHGEPIPAPSLGVSGGGKGKKRQAHGHEGRHRAEAATREGEKTIPVGIGHSALRTGGEKKLTSRQVASLRGENTMIGQSERSIRQNVKDGMESLKSWEVWLDKTEPTGLTDRQKILLKEIEDGDKDDHTQYYTKNNVNKILGALVGGAAKVVGEAAGKVGGAIKDVASNPAVQEGVGNVVSAGQNKVDDVVEDVKNENQTGVSKSWESWLDKNNAIETDHKKENKKEWDGKFSSSTIRDDAENDDKAVSEEESLEELTDGKLEEVEKLKSWQVFLKGFGGTEEDLIHEEDEYMGKKNMHGLRGRSFCQ